MTTETDGAVTPATTEPVLLGSDEWIAMLKRSHARCSPRLCDKCALIARIDAERERADRAEADYAAVRKFIVRDNGCGACPNAWELRGEERHASWCPFARPHPGEGKVLVDAARLRALEELR